MKHKKKQRHKKLTKWHIFWSYFMGLPFTNKLILPVQKHCMLNGENLKDALKNREVFWWNFFACRKWWPQLHLNLHSGSPPTGTLPVLQFPGYSPSGPASLAPSLIALSSPIFPFIWQLHLTKQILAFTLLPQGSLLSLPDMLGSFSLGTVALVTADGYRMGDHLIQPCLHSYLWNTRPGAITVLLTSSPSSASRWAQCK